VTKISVFCGGIFWRSRVFCRLTDSTVQLELVLEVLAVALEELVLQLEPELEALNQWKAN
jgi:hypothetical protein